MEPVVACQVTCTRCAHLGEHPFLVRMEPSPSRSVDGMLNQVLLQPTRSLSSQSVQMLVEQAVSHGHVLLIPARPVARVASGNQHDLPALRIEREEKAPTPPRTRPRNRHLSGVRTGRPDLPARTATTPKGPCYQLPELGLPGGAERRPASTRSRAMAHGAASVVVPELHHVPARWYFYGLPTHHPSRPIVDGAHIGEAQVSD